VKEDRGGLSPAYLQHAIDSLPGPDACFLGDLDDRRHVFEGPGDLLDRGELHPGTDRLLGNRKEPLGRVLFAQPVDNADLGSHDELVCGGFARVSAHSPRAQNLVGEVDDLGTALGMDDHFGVRVVPPQPHNVLRADSAVGGAVAGPELHLPARSGPDEGSEVLVRHEENSIGVLEALDDLDGVGRCAAEVRLRLDRSRGVNVADHGDVPHLLFLAAERLGIDHVGHGASGVPVGQKNSLVRAEYGRRLSHEVDPTEDDYIGVGPGGVLAELKGITNEVRDILDFSQLVVVRKNDSIPLLLQEQNAFQESGFALDGHRLISLLCDLISGPDKAAANDFGEDAFSGHDALADLAEDGTPCMAVLADLGYLQKYVIPDEEERPHGEGCQFQALGGEILREIARADVVAGLAHLVDALDGQQAHLAMSSAVSMCIPDESEALLQLPLGNRIFRGALVVTPADCNDLGQSTISFC